MNIAVPCLIIGITLYSMWGGLKDILSGKSAPHLLTWLIRSALCALLFCALVYEGATFTSLSLWAAQLLCCIGVIVLTVKMHGSMGALTWIDGICLALASCGVMAWALSSDPLYGVVGVILAEFVATCMGVRAAFVERRLESFQFWTLALCASLLSLATAADMTFALVLAPSFSVFNALVNMSVVWWIVRRESPPRRTVQSA